MDHLKGLTVKYGQATSITRSGKVHISGGQETGWHAGPARTTHEDIEQGIVVLENGRDVSITLNADEPFLRDGGEYALMFRDAAHGGGGPISITRTSDGTRYINQPLEKKPAQSNFLRGIFFCVILYWFGVFYFDGSGYYLAFAVLGLIALTMTITRSSREVEQWAKRSQERGAYIQADIDRRKAEKLSGATRPLHGQAGSAYL
jgi:hypothetical protein